MKKPSNGINWSLVTQDGRSQNHGCAGCRYVTRDFYCGYYLQTQRRRPCAPFPGGGCPIKAAGEEPPRKHPGYLFSKKQKRRIAPPRPGRSMLDDNPLAADLYRKGANDLQIAAACGCSKQTVLNWRHRTGRESHWKKRRKEGAPYAKKPASCPEGSGNDPERSC